MGNKESYLRVPPKQSTFGPWFYRTDTVGLGDKPFVGVTAFFVSFAIIEFVLLFGLIGEYFNLKDKSKKSEFLRRSFIRWGSVFFMIFLGWAILGSSFSYTWREGFLEGDLPYRVGLADRVPLRLGLHVGLRGINITLVATDVDSAGKYHGEIIHWNEQYLWSRGQGHIPGWLQGRFGYGPYANLLAQQFRAGQRRGTPLPILETLEWLTLDGESIRWHRWYHNAGYYCHVMLWLAFIWWILTAILTVIRPATGMLMLAFTGATMWFGAALYHGLSEKAHPALAIPFEGQFLEPKFGWAYHLCLVVGILTNIIGLVLWYLFEKLEYTTDAWALSIASFEKPQDIAKPQPKPLEDVTSLPQQSGSRTISHQSTFRRGRSTFGSSRVGRQSGFGKQPSTTGPAPSRPDNKLTAGRSSRRTKRLFGKRIDGADPSSKRRVPTGNVPTLASLGNKLDDIEEDFELSVIAEEEPPKTSQNGETSTTEV
eukprot:m.134351 g.134351  ORF g.134351 m.134351 type:complete len:483 (-) comp9563_c0_seq1:387-1835(-)